jgi:hypothetical protein
MLREQDEGGEFSYPQSGCSDADAADATVPCYLHMSPYQKRHQPLTADTRVTTSCMNAFALPSRPRRDLTDRDRRLVAKPHVDSVGSPVPSSAEAVERRLCSRSPVRRDLRHAPYSRAGVIL